VDGEKWEREGGTGKDEWREGLERRDVERVKGRGGREKWEKGRGRGIVREGRKWGKEI
jgi:hypothetical protein